MFKKYALIGEDLSYSFSVKVHENLFTVSGVPAKYEILEIPRADFGKKQVWQTLNALDGFNVTIPYKQAVLAHVSVEDDVRLLGSINTVKNNEGNLCGYNTDVFGFLQSLEQLGALKVKRFCVIGCGATARAIAVSLVVAGAEHVTVVVRNFYSQRLQELLKALKTANNFVNIYVCDLNNGIGNGKFELLINATPVGTYPRNDSFVFGTEVLKQVDFVFDVVYNPKETALIKMAKKHGKKCCSGFPMLVWQAVMAHKLWYGASFEDGVIEQLIDDLMQKL
ncbi:MAG: shikimate dehydrogenase [Oscillospiraceae bacterium]|jgi:shikimate dehydrogenase|nr:shikimate dehydrogenase [Oscillospiraceae bacterium]